MKNSSFLHTPQNNDAGRSRQRFIPLFKRLLDEGSIDGLVWLDKANKIWQMPWKYHAQTRWNEPDGVMLRELAKHLYGYNGPDEPTKENLSNWKSLIRNGLASFKNEVKKLNEFTNRNNPFRVYQFIDRTIRDSQQGQTARGNFVQNDANSGCAGDSSSHLLLQGVDTSRNPHDGPTNFSINCYSLSGNVSHAEGQLDFNALFSDDNKVNILSDQNHRDVSSTGHLTQMNASPDHSQSDLWESSNDSGLCDFFSDQATSPESRQGTDERFRSRSPLRNIAEGNSDQTIAFSNGIMNEPAQSVSRDVEHGNKPYTILSTAPRGNHCVDPANICNIPVLQGTAIASNILAPATRAYPTSGSSIASLIQDIFLSYNMNHQNYANLISLLRSCPPASIIVQTKYYGLRALPSRILTGAFRICFVNSDHTRVSINLHAPEHGTEFFLELPSAERCCGLSLRQARNTQKILQELKRGVVMEVINNDIYATRYCKAVPYFITPEEAEWKKMERSDTVKIFDFQDSFKRSYNPQGRDQAVKPFVRLTFGEKEPKETSAVRVDILHVQALLMTLQAEENAHSLEPECSLSDDFDKRLEIIDDLMNGIPQQF